MTKAILVLMTLAIGGCGGLQIDMSKTVPAPAAAAATVARVMADWKMTSTPEIFWYRTEPECGDTGYKDQTGRCVGGDQEDGQIIVATTSDPEADTMDDTDLIYLVHEMMHERSDQRGEGGCADHRCDGFRYADGRPLLMPWHDPVYYGGDVDIEDAKLTALAAERAP